MAANKHVRVVGAVIVRDGLVLCAQRGAGALAGMWEFPGGKVEAGETAQAALEREVAEEIGLHVLVGDEVTTTSHEYDFGVVTLTTFYCTAAQVDPVLTEHSEFRWLKPTELRQLDWAPADLPAVAIVTRAGLG